MRTTCSRGTANIAERIVVAQIGLDRERKAGEILERAQVARMHALRIECPAIVRDIARRRARATSASAAAATRAARRGSRARSAPVRPDAAVDLLVGHHAVLRGHDQYHVSPDPRALAAKERDRLAVLVLHVDIVDAVAADERTLARRRGQHVAFARRREKLDRASGRHRIGVVAVAGERERAVGQREHEPAVADRMAVDHVVAHGHRQLGEAGRDLRDPHAEAARRPVAREHARRHAFGQRLGFLREADNTYFVSACSGSVARR